MIQRKATPAGTQRAKVYCPMCTHTVDAEIQRNAWHAPALDGYAGAEMLELFRIARRRLHLACKARRVIELL